MLLVLGRDLEGQSSSDEHPGSLNCRSWQLERISNRFAVGMEYWL